MSVGPSLVNIIGATMTKEERNKFKEFVDDYGNMTIAELLKDSPVLSQDVDFPIPLRFLKMELEMVAFYEESTEGVGFYPFYNYQQASLHDEQLVWALLEAGLFPEEGFVKTIPFEDYSHLIGASKEKTINLPLSVRVELAEYDGKWARKYRHSRLGYFDQEFDLSLALFERMGIEVNQKELQRLVILYWN